MIARYYVSACSYFNAYGQPRARVEVWRGERCLVEVPHEYTFDAMEEALFLVRRMRKAGRL